MDRIDYNADGQNAFIEGKPINLSVQEYFYLIGRILHSVVCLEKAPLVVCMKHTVHQS